MHKEYFDAYDTPQMLLRENLLNMPSTSLDRVIQCNEADVFDDNAVNYPVSLKNCSPPTDIKNKETQQMTGGSFSETFTPSKRSERV
ncbi:hypothetical protein TNCV_2457611 [Trichonephila clavipes]|nr:hypothetical protein TNCV_2457611 [Trichonephila clavipes]